MLKCFFSFQCEKNTFGGNCGQTGIFTCRRHLYRGHRCIGAAIYYTIDGSDFRTKKKQLSVILDKLIQRVLGFFKKKISKKIEANLKKRMDACSILEDLFMLRMSLIQGINYVRLGNGDSASLDRILIFIQNTFDERRNQLPDLMQGALRELSDSNVYKLSEIDDKSYPNHSSAYQLRAVFEQEDSDILFEKICSLSNKGKNEFCSFLSKHYLFGAILQGMDCRYKADLPVLRGLKERFEDKKAESTSV